MKRWFIMLLCCVLLFSMTAHAALEEPDTSAARAAILYEATTDTIIYSSNPDLEVVPASMTKMMTAILTIEHDPELRGMVTVTQEVFDATPSISSTLYLQVGETISVKDCMSFMLVSSVNDAAATLAMHVAGSVEKFVEMMNEKAKEIGCESTTFKDPHGLTSYGHTTTVNDVLKIIRYAMQYDVFREIVGVREEVLPPSNMRALGTRYLTSNRVLDPREPAYANDHSEYMVGGKSGSLYGVGNSFAGLTERDGMELYTVVAQAGTEYIDGVEYSQCYLLTIDLLDYAMNFAVTSVGKGKEIARIPVSGGGTVGIAAAENCGFLYEKGGSGEIVYDYPQTLESPVAAGQVVGSATLKHNGEEKKVDLVAMESVGISGTGTAEPLPGDAGDTGTAGVWIAVAAGAAAVAAAVAVMIGKKKKAPAGKSDS